MKNLFYFIILFLTTLSTALAQIEIEEDSTIVPFYQQIDSVFAGVNLNRMETDYLLKKSLVVDDPFCFLQKKTKPSFLLKRKLTYI